jgi:hypothetical protein
VLQLAAESLEATHGYGACSTSTDMLTSSRPKGGSTTATPRRIVATGGAARFGGKVFLRTSRRRKTRYTEDLDNFRTPAAFLDPVIATVHYSTATHYR